MAVYGPVRHQSNIIWTEAHRSAADVHIIFFWWRTGPYTAIWPKWHELFAILYFISKIIMQVPALTKTNRENINVKCNITDILLKITLITNKPIYKFIGCTATADFHIVLKMEIFLNSTPFNIAFYRITSPWSYCTFLFDIFHTYVGLLIYI
jgi:hypothetical protein